MKRFQTVALYTRVSSYKYVFVAPRLYRVDVVNLSAQIVKVIWQRESSIVYWTSFGTWFLFGNVF